MRAAVAGADVDHVEFRIVGEAVPRVAAAAGRHFPEPARPGRLGDRHRAVGGLAVRPLRRVGRDDVELPQLPAGLGIPRGDEAARAVVGAAVADHDLAVVDPRCAGDRVFLALGKRLAAPDLASVLRVDRDQASVERGEDDLAVPRGDAARRRTAAGEAGPLGTDLGVVGPQLPACLAVVGGDDVVDALVVEHPVDHQRARLDPAHRLEVVVPGKAEPLDGLVVDLRQRAEALLVPRAAVALPVADIARGIGLTQRLSADRGRACAGDDAVGEQGERGECGDRARGEAPTREVENPSHPRPRCLSLPDG